jgi:hypothetical protein
MHRRRHRKNNRQTQVRQREDLFHKKAILKYKCSSLSSLSLSLSLSWYAEYKKLMNFEVFPKPFPSFAMQKFRNQLNLFLQTKNRPQEEKNNHKKSAQKKKKGKRERERL